MLASEILIKARALIEKPENWTQGHLARDNTGFPVDEMSEDAVCFCSLGATTKAAGSHSPAMCSADAYLDLAATEIMQSAMGSVESLNDNTDHPTVLRMFDLAIAKAQASEVTP